jgi:ribonuclease HI
VDRFLIFTDGACSGNPGPGGWAAVVVSPDERVQELAGAADPTTNNRMEMTAVLEALALCKGVKVPIDLYTDSTYVIHGLTQWLAGWKRRGWKTMAGDDVLNRDLWCALDNAAQNAGAGLRWHYVRGHTGCPGNERCDELAVAFSLGKPVYLYDGALARYKHDLSSVPFDTKPPKRQAGGFFAPKKPGVYLSLVDGRLERHLTWAECQARVHGKPRARFKKVGSPEEEKLILQKWGRA